MEYESYGAISAVDPHFATSKDFAYAVDFGRLAEVENVDKNDGFCTAIRCVDHRRGRGKRGGHVFTVHVLDPTSCRVGATISLRAMPNGARKVDADRWYMESLKGSRVLSRR